MADEKGRRRKIELSAEREKFFFEVFDEIKIFSKETFAQTLCAFHSFVPKVN